MALIRFLEKGIFCEQGNFYIDPWQPVEHAVITHAHSDHARAGSASYLCHKDTLPLLELRLGPHHYSTLDWNEPIHINGVKLTLHPAGHIIGSSQIRLEYKGEIWVISGDYKLENDGFSGAFEPVKCHSFVTESTFALPVYNWRPQQDIFREIQQWILANQASGNSSILIAYSLGKSQRLLPCISGLGIPIFAHGAVYNVHRTLQDAGWKLPEIFPVTPETPPDLYKGKIILAPPSALDTPWLKRFNPYRIGICSGWMQVRGHARRRNADASFVLSDHADWNGLLKTIKDTEAEKVYVTHGFQSVLSRYLTEQLDIDAKEVYTEYGNEEEV